MNLTRDRAQSIGWAILFALCLVLTLGLTLRVNAVKSQVRLTERQIVAVKRDKLFLETEFQTRANQQQLTALNDVQFGYVAPTAAQYVEGERQLAAFGEPRPVDAPAPILVASADGTAKAATFPAIVTPLAAAQAAPAPATNLLRHDAEPTVAKADAVAPIAAPRTARAEPARPTVPIAARQTKARPATEPKAKAEPARTALARTATQSTARSNIRAAAKAEPARAALARATTPANARPSGQAKAQAARATLARAATPTQARSSAQPKTKAEPARLATSRVGRPAPARSSAQPAAKAPSARLAAARVAAPTSASSHVQPKAKTSFDMAFADHAPRIRSPKIEEQ